MKISVEKKDGAWTVTVDGNTRTGMTRDEAWSALDLAMSMAKTKEEGQERTMSISRPSRIDGKDPATLTNQDLRQMKTNIFQSIEERKAIEIENDNEDDYRFRQWKAEQSTIVCAIDSELIARRREESTKPKPPKGPVTEVTDAMVGHLAAKLLSDRILDGDTGDIDASARESVMVATMTWTAILRVMAEDRKETP